MNIDLGPLVVKKVIVHEVPARTTKDGGSVVYSKVESNLDDELRRYFREKIIQSLNAAGYSVIFLPETSSPVPELLNAYLQGHTNEFVGMSQDIATHLFQTQTGVNSSGLLCLVEVAVNGTQGIAILKLDKDTAIRIQPILHQGAPTYDLEHVKNLILSGKTKVFKAAIFLSQTATTHGGVLHGTVSDNQRGYAPLAEVADFFLSRFLGCTLAESPAVTTKKYLHSSENFFSNEVPDPERKTRYETALLAELNNYRVALSPIDFAENNLDPDDRQPYVDWLRNNDVSPQEFAKDTALIKTHLRKIKVNFESGVEVFVPPQTLDEQVTITKMDDGRTELRVRDRLLEMRGK